MRTKQVLKSTLVVICIIFSLSGALNVGMSGFYMAVPFMVCLIILSYKTGREYGISAVVFVVACIAISETIYQNPLIFPVLSGERTIEITKDSLYRSFSDSSGGFVTKDTLYINKMSSAQEDRFNNFIADASASVTTLVDDSIVASDNVQKLYKLKAGQKLDILEVKNFGGIDSVNQNYLVTNIGWFDKRDIDDGYIVISSKDIQSKWSAHLGDLMYWPIVPIMISSPQSWGH